MPTLPGNTHSTEAEQVAIVHQPVGQSEMKRKLVCWGKPAIAFG